MAREYSRFLLVNSILNTALGLARSENDRLAITDIIEKWILSVSNLSGDGDPVFGNGIDRDTRIHIDDRLVQTLVRSSITDPDTAQALLEFINQRVDSFLRSRLRIRPPRHAVIDSDDRIVTIKYGLLSRVLSTERYTRLRELGSLEDLVALCLRYASIVSAANQRSIPFEVYEYTHATYGVSLEGFASPLNSQLLLITPNARFCSLFEDTDSVYGSLGSFFNADLVGQSAMINPPFVVDVMNEVARKCIAECERAEANGQTIRIFLKLDATQDGEFYDLLRTSRFLRGLTRLRRMQYWSDDTSELDASGNRKVVGTFDLVGITLTSGFDDSDHDYSDVWRRMEIPWLQKLPVYSMRGRRRLNRLLVRAINQG